MASTTAALNCITREGQFVTCLGKGMTAGNLPVVTRAQLDSIAAKRADLLERLAACRALVESSGKASNLLGRIYDAGDELTREENQYLTRLPELPPEVAPICGFSPAEPAKSISTTNHSFLLDPHCIGTFVGGQFPRMDGTHAQACSLFAPTDRTECLCCIRAPLHLCDRALQAA